jgi:hypothetical protein
MRRIKPHFFPLSQRSRFIAHVPLPENSTESIAVQNFDPGIRLTPPEGAEDPARGECAAPEPEGIMLAA